MYYLQVFLLHSFKMQKLILIAISKYVIQSPQHHVYPIKSITYSISIYLDFEYFGSLEQTVNDTDNYNVLAILYMSVNYWHAMPTYHNKIYILCDFGSQNTAIALQLTLRLQQSERCNSTTIDFVTLVVRTLPQHYN